MIQLLVAVFLLGGAPAPKDGEITKDNEAAARRTQFLVESLQRRLPLDRPLEAPLKEILGFLEGESSPSDGETNPLVRVKIVANDAAFKKVRGDTFEIADAPFKLPMLPKATLESALEILCEQVGATIVIRRDHIELVPASHHFGRELKPGESAFLVNYFAVKQPLDEVLDTLSQRFGRTVILDPKAADKGHEAVTAKLLNIPFESAIELLADLSELKVICKGGALLVTTPERAKALRGDEPAPARKSTLEGKSPLGPPPKVD